MVPLRERRVNANGGSAGDGAKRRAEVGQSPAEELEIIDRAGAELDEPVVAGSGARSGPHGDRAVALLERLDGAGVSGVGVAVGRDDERLIGGRVDQPVSAPGV